MILLFLCNLVAEVAVVISGFLFDLGVVLAGCSCFPLSDRPRGVVGEADALLLPLLSAPPAGAGHRAPARSSVPFCGTLSFFTTPARSTRSSASFTERERAAASAWFQARLEPPGLLPPSGLATDGVRISSRNF